VVEIRPAVQDDDGLPPPDFSRMERCLSDQNTAFARRRGPFGLQRPRRIRGLRRQEHCCEAGDDEMSPHGHTVPFHPGFAQMRVRAAVDKRLGMCSLVSFGHPTPCSVPGLQERSALPPARRL